MLPLKRDQLIFSILTSFSLLLLSSQNLYAADLRFESSDFSLKASPAGRVSEVVLLTNLTDSRKTISLAWEGYELEQGNYLNPLVLTKHSIDFASVSPTTLSLNPQATGTVNISFQIPESTISGDYYGSLVALSEGSEEKVDFTLTVLGKLDEKIEVLATNDDGRKLEVRLVNQGNISIPVKGRVLLHNLFGKKYDLSSEELLVRAGEIKTISFAHSPLESGLWQEEVTLHYGSKDTAYTTLNSFWINPLLFFVPFALILTALTIIFVLTWKNR
jgi:hypothetical protein